jgi:signal transduction histidine kinase
VTDGDRRTDPRVDDLPCGVVSFFDDGTVAAANLALCTMLGMAAPTLIGRHIESILAIGSRIFYQTHLFPLLRLHNRADEIFVLLRAADGTDIGVLLTGVRRERDGRWITDCALLRVVERRKFEDALVQARIDAEDANERLREQAVELEAQSDELQALNDELQEHAAELDRLRSAADQANRAKSTFLTTMSHELRTPLNAIGGYAQLIEMQVHGPTTDAQREALARIVASQRHLLRLINEILNLARVESGQVEYVPTVIALRDLMDAVLLLVEPQFTARDLHCDVEVSADLTAFADRDKVHRILVNLLSNAGKFTPSGGRVTIDAHDDPAHREYVYVRIRDTGAGIPRDQLERIFEPFTRVDTPLTRRTEGTGLGLAISRELARGMGGELRARSGEGLGSSFTLTLPRSSR